MTRRQHLGGDPAVACIECKIDDGRNGENAFVRQEWHHSLPRARPRTINPSCPRRDVVSRGSPFNAALTCPRNGDASMARTKTLATALGVTVALALGGIQSSAAQPGAGFQNQGIREVPRSDQSLLEPQPPPDCAFKGPLSNPPTAEETRMKLDYE